MTTKNRQLPEALIRPRYTLREVSLYARVPVPTLRAWVESGVIVVPAAGGPATLSFLNLVEVFVLGDIRRQRGVSMARVCGALHYVSEQMGVERPLICQAFRTDGVERFVERMGQGQDPSWYDSRALRDAMNSRLERVTWSNGIATGIFPLSRASEGTEPRLVAISPEFGFGQPVIVGTGIRVSVIRQRFKAGEAMRELADDYGVAIEQIEEAVRMRAA